MLKHGVVRLSRLSTVKSKRSQIYHVEAWCQVISCGHATTVTQSNMTRHKWRWTTAAVWKALLGWHSRIVPKTGDRFLINYSWNFCNETSWTQSLCTFLVNAPLLSLAIFSFPRLLSRLRRRGFRSMRFIVRSFFIHFVTWIIIL